MPARRAGTWPISLGLCGLAGLDGGRRSGLLIPVAATYLLVVATVHLFEDGYAARVLRGVGVLLACACLSAMNEPMGEVTAGSSYRR